MKPRHFLTSESGAVAVDWVVLTGALVGLGLAASLVVSAGVENVSEETAEEMGGIQIRTRFAALTDLFSTDFSNGASGWLGGNVVSLTGFGDVLQLGPGEQAEMSINIPPGATSATLSFDLIGGDDLDGEPATIMVNGQPVSVYRDDHGNITVSGNDVSGISVDVQQQYTNSPVGAGTHGHDSMATYTITVDNPGTSVTLGVHSGANAHTGDEFYAVDNVSVVSS